MTENQTVKPSRADIVKLLTLHLNVHIHTETGKK